MGLRTMLAVVVCLAAATTATSAQRPESARVFGKVVDQDGNGVAGARVFFVSRAAEAMPDSPVERVEARTRAQGRFSAQLLVGHAYTAWAVSRNGDGIRVTDVVEGAIAGRPVRLTLAGRWSHPRVRVVGRDRWRQTRLEALVLTQTHNRVEVALTLNEHGEAEIPPLPGERGSIAIRAEDGPHVALRRFAFDTREPITIELAAPLDLDVAVVSKPTGKPLAHAWIAQLPSMYVPGGFIGGVLPMRALGNTGAGGSAHVTLAKWIDTSEPGKQFLLIGAPEHAATYVEVAVATDEPKLRVELDPGSTLVGRIVRPDGTPAAGARLMIHSYVRCAGQPGLNAGMPGFPVTCSDEGRFEVHGLTRRNRFQVVALRSGLGLPDRVTSPMHLLASHPPAARARTDLGTIELAKLAELDLRIERPDGSPAAEARMLYSQHDLRTWLTHSPDSRGHVRMLWPADVIDVGAFEPHGGVGRHRSVLQPGKQTRVLRLSQPVPVSGIVRDASGKPVAGAWVRLWNRPKGPDEFLRQLCFEQQRESVESDANGAFELWAAGVAGDYNLRAGKRWEATYAVSPVIGFTVAEDRSDLQPFRVVLGQPQKIVRKKQ